MKKLAVFILTTTLAVSAGIARDNPGISVESMPPSVVSTSPEAGETAVDPSLTEIRVTFSKDMMTENMWSWCSQSPETFPEIESKGIHYLDDKRTCVLPVKLMPGKTYVIWINCEKYNNFRDTKNNPAVPYLLVFETASEVLLSSRNAAEKAAVSAATAWLALVDEGAYVKSWEEAARYFKNSVTRDRWVQAIKAAREPLGKNLSRRVLSSTYRTSLPGAPDGEYVLIRFESSFENKNSATETVTPMMDEDGQ